MQPIEVYISGVHSDPDPSPGVGVARSLHDAFPHAVLLAVDYSVRSSGLHHPVFDDVRLQPVWSELDLPTYSSQIRECLERGACWISGLDVETDWLATVIPDHPRLLVPSTAAQHKIRKPALACASCLSMRVPEFLPASSTPDELHSLGRRSGWRLWVKGNYHEAYPAGGFAELRRQIRALESHWPIEDIFVQRHVTGLERSVTFAAYRGRLLQAVEVEKRSVTTQGKTWAAAVAVPSQATIERLTSFISDACWTGGGEVEFIRDGAGIDWLIDFNPRFPAYIFGVTLCGHNLPSQLVGAALHQEVPACEHAARQFIRVVHELPVREELPLPRLVAGIRGLGAAGKHPSHQPSLVKLLKVPSSEAISPMFHRAVGCQSISHAKFPGIVAALDSSRRTPYRVRDPDALDATLTELARGIGLCTPMPRLQPALSIKTDPHPRLAHAFVEREWWAEVISLAELDWALAAGFSPSQIVFNGPAVGRLNSASRCRVGTAFADSVESLETIASTQSCDVVGLRLRPSGTSSRFGVDLTDYPTFERVTAALRAVSPDKRLGVHLHMASDVTGPTRWHDALDQALAWADALAATANVKFAVFDIGGGWHADDFQSLLLPALPEIQARIAKVAPTVKSILMEPGKAVAGDTAWLVTTLTEVRADGSGKAGDVVVDASIADLPMAHLYGHRMLQVRAGQCVGWLRAGEYRVLGSICMETDILAEGVSFPSSPEVGDVLLVASAGGYNASMAWPFAGGVSRDE